MKLRKTVWLGRALWTKPFATVQRTINPIKAVSASIDLNVIVLLVSKPEVNQETNNVVSFCLSSGDRMYPSYETLEDCIKRLPLITHA